MRSLAFFVATVLFVANPFKAVAGVDALQATQCNGNTCTVCPLGNAVSFGYCGNDILYACCAHQVDPGANLQVRIRNQWRTVTRIYRNGNTDVAVLRVNMHSRAAVTGNGLYYHKLATRSRYRSVTVNTAVEMQSLYIRGQRNWRGRMLRVDRARQEFYFSEPPIQGDSGGAVVDIDGYMIGIISAYNVEVPEGIAGSAEAVRDTLEENGIQQPDDANEYEYIESVGPNPQGNPTPVDNPPQLPDAPPPGTPISVPEPQSYQQWQHKYDSVCERLAALETAAQQAQQSAELQREINERLLSTTQDLRTADVELRQADSLAFSEIDKLKAELTAQITVLQTQINNVANSDNTIPGELTALITEVNTLRNQLAEMQDAELLVRFKVGEQVSQDTVDIFDPEDSLNLYIDANAIERALESEPESEQEHSHD